MAIFIIALLFFILLTLGAGGLVFAVSRRRGDATRRRAGEAPRQARSGRAPVFRWRYVLAPSVVLVAALAAAVFFFRLLPAEVAYHFAGDGSGDGFAGRGVLIAALVAPQVLLAFLAAAIAHVVARVGRQFIEEGKTPASTVENVIALMSNMVVLPQVVLFFAMLDIFSYNAFQIHLLAPWIVALVVLLVGAPVLAVLFFRAIRQAKQGTRDGNMP